MKNCRDCKYVSYRWLAPPNIDRCKLFNSWADWARKSAWKNIGNGQCGDNADHFEPKPPSVFQRVVTKILNDGLVEESKEEFNFNDGYTREMHSWIDT